MTSFPESEYNNPLSYKGRWLDREDSIFSRTMTRWNMDKRKWQHTWLLNDSNGTTGCFFEYDNERMNGIFYMNKCLLSLNKQKASEIHNELDVRCDPIIDKYISVHPDWEDGWVNPVFRDGSFANQYGSSSDNPNKNWIFQDYHNIFDGHPYFYIEYTNLCDMNVIVKDTLPGHGLPLNPYQISTELEDWYLKLRPHHCARTMGELLRLIIDWDLAYHHFNNREDVAILAHNIMSSIDMPIDIYEIIISEIPPSIVVRYINNDPDVFNFGERPKTPQIVIEWLKEKYWTMRAHIYDEISNVQEFNENHYCHR